MPWEIVHAGNGMIDNSLPPPKYPREEVFAIIREKGFQGLMENFVLPDWETQKKRTFKQKVKARIRRWLSIIRQARKTRCNTVFLLFRWLIDNGFVKMFRGSPLARVSRMNAHLENDGVLELGGDLDFGGGPIRHVPAGTIIQIRKNGKLATKGNVGMAYGSCIEVHEGGELTIGDKFGANTGLTIVCGGKITIGEDVMCGRHVTLRNSNGNHPMNIPGAKNSRPLVIGDHVWFCENSTVMNGVKIGSGAVIGSYAVVYDNVPANTLVMGNPAKVVMENVQWKR
jgi:acetyltransferase-like isoleucine patch superfamily enzyme